MKILHIVHQFLPEFVGGTELYTQTLAEQQVEAGHSVSIFTPTSGESSWPEPAIETGIRVYRLPVGPRSRRQVFFQTLRETESRRAFASVLAREQPDLVHGQHFMGLPGTLAEETNAVGIPLVITVHDYWYLCANAQLITNYDQSICQGPASSYLNCGRCAVVRAGYRRVQWLAPGVAPLMAYRNHGLRRILAMAKQVIFPSQFVEKIFREMGMPGDDTIVIPHGIDIPAQLVEDSPELPSTSPNRPSENRQLRIGYIGSLAWQKGIHNLLAAVNRLPVEGISCDIYGSLTAHPEYIKHLRKMSSHPGTQFHGQIAHEDIWSKLVAFDVLVLPTLWYESFGLIIQEAFAAKVPPVASRIGAVEENIRDGVDGLLVPPDDIDALFDALFMLYQEPQRLLSLQAGIGPVRTIKEHLADIAAVYTSVLSPPVTI